MFQSTNQTVCFFKVAGACTSPRLTPKETIYPSPVESAPRPPLNQGSLLQSDECCPPCLWRRPVFVCLLGSRHYPCIQDSTGWTHGCKNGNHMGIYIHHYWPWHNRENDKPSKFIKFIIIFWVPYFETNPNDLNIGALVIPPLLSWHIMAYHKLDASMMECVGNQIVTNFVG